MTAEEFRAALIDLGFAARGGPDQGQSEFARWLVSRGHSAQLATVQRSVRRWCQVGPPGEVSVIVSLLRELRASATPE